MVVHPFEPIFTKSSQILILGSFPSRISRQQSFYYGNKNNRFWQVLTSILNESCQTNEQKLALLAYHKIALFDVVKWCEIKASSDASIKNVVPNDIKNIVANSNVKAIFLNGKMAQRLFERFFGGVNLLNLASEKPAIFTMPSTSPANARFSLDALIKNWSAIREFLD